MKTILTLTLAFALSSCAYQAVQDLTPKQIEAVTKLKEVTDGDVYMCLNVGGPPPAGTLTLLVYPKSAKPAIIFDRTCVLIQSNVSGLLIDPRTIQMPNFQLNTR